MNQMPSDCSMSNCKAKNVEIDETTAPSMMPIIGTTSEDRNETLRRNKKNTMVPTKAKNTAPIMRSSTLAVGTKNMTNSKPNPAHSVVPVVVGSTNRFCVSSCMTNPDIAIAAPARINAIVRGRRVMKNISEPLAASKMLYSPTISDATSNPATTTMPTRSFQSNNFDRVCALRRGLPAAECVPSGVVAVVISCASIPF